MQYMEHVTLGMIFLFQEEHLEQVSITFRSSDGVVGNTLRLHVPEYSGVLYDCMKGNNYQLCSLVSFSSWLCV